MTHIPDDEGLLPGGIVPDETTQGTVVSGPSSQPVLGAPEPLEKWSDEDPEYIEFEEQEEDSETDEPEELTEEELEAEPLESDPLDGPQWVRYELWAQNLDDETDWVLMATEDVDGEALEAEVGQIPTATRMRFRLRLIDANGQASKWSDAVDITTPRDLTAPPRPLPPVVTGNNGFVTFSTDGALTGETPPDLSHLPLYIQQMHPAGDPDGEPGDPVRLTEFRTAGHHTTGQFQDRVEHRAFLTAVDTTGNESPRSEYVYFTPTEPVDAERIRDEVDSISERVGEGLEQSLTAGLVSMQADLDEFRQEWEDAEWDEEAMQELRDRQRTFDDRLTAGLAEAEESYRRLAIRSTENLINDRGFDVPLNTDPAEWWADNPDVWEQRSITFASADVGSYLALMIEAWDGTAQGIYYRASDSPLPVEPGETYQIRFKRFRNSDPTEVETSINVQWSFRDGTTEWDGRYHLDEYASMEQISHQVTVPDGAIGMRPYWRLATDQSLSGSTALMGLVDPSIFKMNDGQLTVDGTLLARHVDMEDFTADQGFLDHAMVNLIQGRLAEFDEALIGNVLIKDGAITPEKVVVGPRNQITDRDFKTVHDGETASWHDAGRNWETVSVSWSNRAFLRIGDDALASGDNAFVTYGGSLPGNAVIPCQPGEVFKLRFQVLRYVGWSSDDDYRARFRWVSDGQGIAWSTLNFSDVGNQSWAELEATAPEGADSFYLSFAKFGSVGAARGIGNVSLRSMTTSEMIVHGAVKAVQIDVQDLAAANARMQTLWAGFAGFSEAQIDNLLANVGHFKTINAPLVQSHTQSNRGWKLQPSGEAEIYDGNGRRVLHAHDGGLDVDGHATLRSADISGPLRVGGDGEGGIVPAGDRTRFLGRTPATTGPTDTMAYGRTGQIDPPTSRVVLRVTYETPTPTSARVPITGIHIGSSHAPQALPTTATQNRDASGFRIRVQYMAGWHFWVYYTAFWGDPPNSDGSIEAG